MYNKPIRSLVLLMLGAGLLICGLLFAEREGFFRRYAPKALRDNEPLGSHPFFHAKKQPLRAAFAEREGFEPPEV